MIFVAEGVHAPFSLHYAITLKSFVMLAKLPICVQPCAASGII